MDKTNYSINKKINKNNNIIRKKRIDKNCKPSGKSTELHRIYHTCKCKDCMKKRKNVKIIKNVSISKNQMITEMEVMKKEIIEEIKRKKYFPKSLDKLSTLSPKEWDMFIPVIRMWLVDKNTLPDKDTTFEEIKKLVFDAHKKAKLNLSKYNNYNNFDKNEFFKFISNQYKNIKILT